MKPIEPGCLAVHTLGRNAGVTVRCMRFVGTAYLQSGGVSARPDCWEVDKPMYWASSEIPVDRYASEKWLIRIDGYDEYTQESEPVPGELERV